MAAEERTFIARFSINPIIHNVREKACLVKEWVSFFFKHCLKKTMFEGVPIIRMQSKICIANNCHQGTCFSLVVHTSAGFDISTSLLALASEFLKKGLSGKNILVFTCPNGQADFLSTTHF